MERERQNRLADSRDGVQGTDQNAVVVDDGVQPVRDTQDSGFCKLLAHRLLDELVRASVHVGRALVHDDDPRATRGGTGQQVRRDGEGLCRSKMWGDGLLAPTKDGARQTKELALAS